MSDWRKNGTEWDMKSTMINAIGAMHAALRTKPKSPEANINFRVEMKKRRRKPRDEEDSERPRRDRAERGPRT